MTTFPHRLGLQQRILPAYRAPFFEALAEACAGGLEVLAGQPMPGEAMGPQGELEQARLRLTRNRYIFRSGMTLVWQVGILDWLDARQPKALIMEANPRNLSNGRASRWMRARGLPVIGWGLGAPAFSGPVSRWRESRRRRYLSQFDALITYSRQGAGEFVRAGFPPGRVFIAPNAVASKPAAPPLRPTGQNRAPTILYVGRLQPRKRVDLLLEAGAHLPGPLQPHLWIVGDGPDRLRLEALAHETYPQAEFLGDLRGQELEERFDQADLFVLPGTGGLAVQQAMAHALPVIVAEADGTQNDLVRPENGWLLPAGNTDALVRTLQTALQNPERLRRMGLESYRIVSEEVNLEAMVEAFIQAVHQTATALQGTRKSL